MEGFLAMLEAIRRMRPITLILGTAMALVLVLFSVSTAHGQARDPRVEAARAQTRSIVKPVCNSAAGFMNAPLHGTQRWQCKSFGATRCSASPAARNRYRCTGFYRIEATEGPLPLLGVYASATFHFKITPDGRSLRISLTSSPRWRASEYNASLG
jgi:hypothetical protein